MIRLVLGGDKSGKSDLAMRLFMEDAGPRLMLATGRALDAGLRAQILEHRRRRPVELPVRETGADLCGALRKAVEAGNRALLVDSLDFWLFSVLEADRDPADATVLDEALAACADKDVALTLVSSECGLGPIAADAATRGFVRALGALNQAVARQADTVLLAVAGQPLKVKG